MLVINNGVPKSGTTMFQRILRRIGRLGRPSERWQNDWSAPSVGKDRILDYVRDGEWREKDILVKLHLHFRKGVAALFDPEIRIMVSHRFLPDLVLSRFYHEMRHQRISLEQKTDWLAAEGFVFAKNTTKYRKPWQGKPNVPMVSYDSTMADPLPVLHAIAGHLKKPLSDRRAKSIAEDCVRRLQPGEAAHNNEHVRSPGVSTSRQEIPKDLYAELCAMEAAAGEAGDTALAR